VTTPARSGGQNGQIKTIVDAGMALLIAICFVLAGLLSPSGIDRHAKGHHLVLSTCWPFDAVMRGAQRYIVEAELVK
jgi:hypothetical protein